MTSRFLLDTNALIRRFTNPRKLSSEQTRILDLLESQNHPLSISAITLFELALMKDTGAHRIRGGTARLLETLDQNPRCEILPLTTAIAIEIAALGDSLRDPADRAIVATARVHGLSLMTADERIIGSRLVPVVE